MHLQIENKAIDYALEVLVNAGAVVCRSAMNNRYKIDVASGADYDNYFTEIKWNFLFPMRDG